jgi:hypothetical protein
VARKDFKELRELRVSRGRKELRELRVSRGRQGQPVPTASTGRTVLLGRTV